MENNSPFTGQSCLLVIIKAILFIVSPILVTLYSFMFGTSTIKIFYLFSIFLMVLCFSIIPEKRTKFVCAAVVVLIYAVIFSSWYATCDIYIDGESASKFQIFVMTFTLMAPCYYLGIFLEYQIKKYKSKIKMKKICQIDSQIKEIEDENIKLRRKISDGKLVLRIVDLLERCGGNITAIKENYSFSELENLENNILSNKEKIQALKSERDKIAQV